MLNSGSMERKRLPEYLLTAALAIVFAWFGIDKFRNAYLWIGFMPAWMDGFLGFSTKGVWIFVVGGIEIILAAMLLVPARRIRQAGAVLIALHLAAVLVQVGWNDIGVRDLGLLLSSVALAFLL